MRKTLIGAAAFALGLTGALAFTASASATDANVVASDCHTGWYVNPDETEFLPKQVDDGFLFEGKDLVHHAAPSNGIDLADMNSVNYSFTATTAGKVVFKVETSAPYSTIVTNADGKLWSTAMTYDQEGGQGHPVDHYTDFIGKPVKSGKVEFSGASQVETFGVGYWVEEGSTVVKSIAFHGTTYNLACVAESPSPTPSASESQSPSPSPSASESVSPSPTQSQGPVAITPAAPKIGKVTCDQFELLTDERDGLKWDVVDTKVNGDTVTVKVVVTAADGVIKDGVQTEWDLSFKIPANCTATPQPTEVPTSPAAGGGNLPVTGPGGGTNVPLIAGLAGIALIGFGGAGLAWARRRRDQVEFTA